MASTQSLGIAVLRARAIISHRFSNLLSRVQPNAVTHLKFLRHKSTVSSRLAASFAISKIQAIGSSSRQSAISQTSDLDLLVVLRKTEATWGGALMSSDSVLRTVRKQLEERYFNTDLGKDGQAITIKFGDGQYPVDVVPAVFNNMVQVGNTSFPSYYIPGGDGGWLLTSPAAHDRYIAAADARSGGKLKHVAKLMKYWRWCRTPEIPLSSFHIEMVLAARGICNGVKTYSSCICDLFLELSRRDCAALIDPLSISGYIKAANTDAKRQRAIAAIDDSAFHAERAVMAERIGDAAEAIRQWDIVFNSNFPKS